MPEIIPFAANKFKLKQYLYFIFKMYWRWEWIVLGNYVRDTYLTKQE